MSTTYRLPNGKFTKSLGVYLRRWNSLKRCVEKKLGVKVYAYDPDFAICMNERQTRKFGRRLTAEVPLWLALQFQSEAP